MAVQSLIDVTVQINATGRVTLDAGGFDYADIQLISPTSTASFQHTNDAGDITGVSDGSAASATNFVTMNTVDLSSGSNVTTLATTGIVRASNVGRFIRVIGPGLTVTKAVVRLFKID